MFDAHAHHGNIESRNAFVCTSSIPSIDEAEILKSYSFFAIGHLPSSKLDNLDNVDTLLSSGFHLGEVGLDRRFDDIECQIKELNALLEISKGYNRCTVFHSVGHIEKLLEIIKERNIKKFIFHGFTGSYEIAKRIIALGGLISINSRALKTKSFEKIITLPFVTESDMITGKEQIDSLRLFNDKLSSMLERDVESLSEKYLLEYMNG